MLRHQNRAITMRYVPPGRYFYYTREREADEQDYGAFLETEYFTQSKRNGHSMVDMGGAFHVLYHSVQERMEGCCRRMTLLQTMFPNSKSQDNALEFGGFLAVAGYHIGSLDAVGRITNGCCSGPDSMGCACGEIAWSAMCWMCILRLGKSSL